jgi:DNA (cytosine-5)-methyltransferase 1
MKPVVIDLFAGCGGLSLGLEKAGFQPIFVNELNDSAMQTYLINRESTNPLLSRKYHSSNIKDMVLNTSYIDDLLSGFKSDYKVQEVDLVVGGPPCQGYSGIGHRRSYSVEKKQLPSNHLYQDMAYVISRIHPKIFLFENVRGLLSARWTKDGNKGEIWADVKKTFREIPGYQIQEKLIFAKDFGIPQYRPRVIMIGVREDVDQRIENQQRKESNYYFPDDKEQYPNLNEMLDDLVDSNYKNGGSTNLYPSDPMNNLQEELRFNPKSDMVLRKGSEVKEQDYSKHSQEILTKFEFMQKNNGVIPDHLQTKKFSQRLLPPKWDNREPFITITSMPDDYVHYSQPRTLTVREWARLQFFPDWYLFSGNRTTGGIRRAGNPRMGNFDRELPKYTQIGNAVPVKLAEAFGKHLFSLLVN